MFHRGIDQTAAHDVLNDGNLPVRLDPGSECPENFGRIIDVDIFVENENVFRPVPGQRRSRGAAGVAFRHLFHRDKYIEQRMAPARANRLHARHGFSATA